MKRLVFLALMVVGIAACDRGGATTGRLASCTCEYLTDRDEPGRIDIELCAPPRDIDEAARSCAQGLGIGVVNQCRCAGGGDRSCEKVGECREAER